MGKQKILFASSEVTPFAKTGGLADVSASLPSALFRKQGEHNQHKEHAFPGDSP